MDGSSDVEVERVSRSLARLVEAWSYKKKKVRIFVVVVFFFVIIFRN